MTVLDTWLLFADAKGDAKKLEFPDLLHPNKLGYAKWAAALRPLLATNGFIETKPEDFAMEPGFVSLFNGKDLSGWGFRAKKTFKQTAGFDGKKASDDSRYKAINGRLVVTTPPEGRRVQQLWTTKEFPKDFTLKLEFRATPNADSGVFIRKPQLQCRDYYLGRPMEGPKELQTTGMERNCGRGKRRGCPLHLQRGSPQRRVQGARDGSHRTRGGSRANGIPPHSSQDV